MAPCRTRTVVTEWLAAGERIVAFARPGKSLELPFWVQIGGILSGPADTGNPPSFATNSKAGSDRHRGSRSR